MSMREIKFRCFYRDKMYLVGELDMYSDGSFGAGIFQGERFSPDSEHCSPLMQYTGLKDKNGVEIYEGDLLKGREEGNGETTAWRDVYYTVFYQTESASFQVRERGIREDSAWCDSLSEIIDEYEVIGNIYQSPELLTKI